MKQLFNIKYLCSFLCSFIVLNVYAQFLPIVVNNTPVVGTCSLGAYGNAQISVPTEALSGDNILLNITCAENVACPEYDEILKLFVPKNVLLLL